MNFTYDLIETQIVEVLPELKAAADLYVELEGKPGEDCGPYIFFENIFGTYIEVLLNMHDSHGRNWLLSRAYQLVDEMLESSDQDVRDLAYIGELEFMDLWYYSRALKFLGPVARRELDQRDHRWHEAFDLKAQVDEDREIIDTYCTREVIIKELRSEGIDRRNVPGNTYPNESQMFSSLEVARHSEDAVVYLGRFSSPYLICPPDLVKCNETTLFKLAQDLDKFDDQEPDPSANAYVIFPRIPLGERVWQMNHHEKKHTRYEGQLWISDMFTQKGFGEQIKEVLDGSRNNLER